MINIFRAGSRIIGRTSPVILVASGAALALSLPPVRRGVRSVAVLATRGVLGITSGIKTMGCAIQKEAADIITEARETKTAPWEATADKISSLHQKAKLHRHRAAVTTTMGALAVADKAKALRNNFRDIVQEAKAERAEQKESPRGSHEPVEAVTGNSDDATATPIKPSVTRRTRKKEMPT